MPHASPHATSDRPPTGAAAVLAVLVAVSDARPAVHAWRQSPPASASRRAPPVGTPEPAAAARDRPPRPRPILPPMAEPHSRSTCAPVSLPATALQAAVDRARAAFGLDAVAVGVSADARFGWKAPGRRAMARPRAAPRRSRSPAPPTFTAAIVLQLVRRGASAGRPGHQLPPDLALARVTVRSCSPTRAGSPTCWSRCATG
jgi:hypothetical protein